MAAREDPASHERDGDRDERADRPEDSQHASPGRRSDRGPEVRNTGLDDDPSAPTG